MVDGTNPLQGFWATFLDNSAFIEVKDDPVTGGSVAGNILNKYNITCNNPEVAGMLENLDIKGMDAYSVIRLSLLEGSASMDNLLEMVVTPDASVDFKVVGSYSGNVTDIYHSLATETYKEECVGVMITGAKPFPTINSASWKPIWGTNNSSKLILDTSAMNWNCASTSVSKEAVIIFNEPHLDPLFEDGIDSLFNGAFNKNPYARLLSYAYCIIPPVSLMTRDVDISTNADCKAPFPVGNFYQDSTDPDLGTLVPRPIFQGPEPDDCWTDPRNRSATIYQKGVKVMIPDNFRYVTLRGTKVDKFIDISEVYCIGHIINNIRSSPATDAASINIDNITSNDIVCQISIKNVDTNIIRLHEGTHYIVAYDSTTDSDSYKVPYIVFADNSKLYNDPNTYGKPMDFYIVPECPYYLSTPEGQAGTACLRHGTILPLENMTGIWIDSVWAKVSLKTPSITITDSAKGNAKAIADALVYNIAPIWMVENPSPVAFNGQLLDLSKGMGLATPDKDPTTVQNLEDTEYEKALIVMANGGGGISTNLSFIHDEDAIAGISKSLYNFMNNGEVVETTYICGPNATPQIGGYGPAGGIVNNISYSYNDSGSYTISVNEGPYVVEQLADSSNSYYTKQADDQSFDATVIQNMGNNVTFKVRMDSYGDRIAINCSQSIINVGDKVRVSVHNNPIEA